MKYALGLRNFRRYQGDWSRQFEAAAHLGASYLQVDGIPPEEESVVTRLVEQTGIRIQSITCLNTYLLGPDWEKSRSRQEKARFTIAQAARLGTPCVSMFTGHDPARSLEANLDTMQEVFTPLVEMAEAHDVTIVLENCPMGGGARPLGNLAYCPANWAAIFERIPSPHLGLELDFGHLPGLGIDPIRAIAFAGRRIRHVGMKDARPDPEILVREGYFGAFAPHTHPGSGILDFAAIISALAEVGYQGPLTLDHVHPAEDSEETFAPAARYLQGIVANMAG